MGRNDRKTSAAVWELSKKTAARSAEVELTLLIGDEVKPMGSQVFEFHDAGEIAGGM
jgi:hypothetical protein